MSKQAVSPQSFRIQDAPHGGRRWPVGSELMIAFALGAGGWYVIVRLIQWVTS